MPLDQRVDRDLHRLGDKSQDERSDGEEQDGERKTEQHQRDRRGGQERAIHVLALIRPVAQGWPPPPGRNRSPAVLLPPRTRRVRPHPTGERVVVQQQGQSVQTPNRTRCTPWWPTRPGRVRDQMCRTPPTMPLPRDGLRYVSLRAPPQVWTQFPTAQSQGDRTRRGKTQGRHEQDDPRSRASSPPIIPMSRPQPVPKELATVPQVGVTALAIISFSRGTTYGRPADRPDRKKRLTLNTSSAAMKNSGPALVRPVPHSPHRGPPWSGRRTEVPGGAANGR